MHCYERPTVQLALEVPRERGVGDWEWSPCQVVKPVEEYAYTGQEICRLLLVYGGLIADSANAADPVDYPQIRLMARGLYTGRTLGSLYFERDAVTGLYAPVGDPMVALPPMYTWPDEVIRGWAVMTGRTGGKPCGSCPSRGPERPSDACRPVPPGPRSGEAARGRQGAA
ncbi:hypothetical protein P3T39_000761 [Kitasatospora sp. GP82]|nr:hypothetical protein [Kitasatospora sp. GP82]MDH6576075.1 hypothetical protein [Kitasatospora sp. MAP5-34]